MIRSRGVRIASFAVAVGVTATLIAFAVSSTGAYFTDSHDGTINVGTGTVSVNPTSSLSLNFTNLLPGTFQTQSVKYTTTGTGPEDIWLVLPASSAKAFNGVPKSGPIPLGRYGHFAVNSPAGSFTSYNLASDPKPPSTDSCPVDAKGHGGSNQQAANASDYTVPYCPVPNAILLSSGLNYGDTGTAVITFGYTQIMSDSDQQGQATARLAKFKLVATQHGILPSDPNN